MDVVDEIKERIDAVELISNYVQLKKAGRNYKGVCPFHSEKTPSFVVFPDTGTWHCFGACAEGGDIFSFVTKFEGWDFRTALEELARRAGVELRPRTEQEQAKDKEHERLRQALASTTTYYYNLLLNAPQAEPARAYVTNRGLTANTIEVFQLGYALDEWHALERFMSEQGFSRQELVAAGLLVEREDSNNVYDRFRGRLMIPIRDRRGRVIGFGARTLDPDGVPKYLNSPQTPLFDKSNTLYGLDLAAQGIRAADRAVVVEGYMDVMQGYQAGFRDMVAQLGTALTEDNLRRITRYTRRVVLALDADAAGQSATMRGLDVARETLEREWQPVFDVRGLTRLEGRLSADVRVLTLPPGQDPDQLIAEDATRWAKLVDQAAPLVEHYVQTVLKGRDLTDPKVKKEVARILVPVICDVADTIERAHYAQRLALALRVDERVLLDQVLGSKQPRRQQRRPTAVKVQPAKKREPLGIELYCLWRLLHKPQLLEQIETALAQMQFEPLSATDFDDPQNREIFQAWQQLFEIDSDAGLDKLFDRLPQPLHARLDTLATTGFSILKSQRHLQDAQFKPGHDVFDVGMDELRLDLLYSVLRLRKHQLDQHGREVHYLLKEAESLGDTHITAFHQARAENAEAINRLDKAIACFSTLERSTNSLWQK